MELERDEEYVAGNPRANGDVVSSDSHVIWRCSTWLHAGLQVLERKHLVLCSSMACLLLSSCPCVLVDSHLFVYSVHQAINKVV